MTKATQKDVAAEAKRRAVLEERAQAANDVLEVLVNAILDRQLVPLLGAGISAEAQWSNKVKLPERAQNVPELVKIIGKTLYQLALRPKVGSVESRKGLTVDAYERKSLAELCELFVDEYESARGVRSDEAHEKLCEALRIAEFVWLQPTRAHRLIAFLACEGLVPEVVTTNYDCCLERAFAEANGRDPEPVVQRGVETSERSSGGVTEDLGWGPDVDVWVSHDLQTYRRSAVRLRTDAPSRDQPFLRIHKINGCALKLKEDRAGYAKRILLTERQLQSWRDRQWAADMIRDRLRTRKILTCGFGSEEPQVRHTVALITEEEPTSGNKRGDTSLLKRPNLIVVAGYVPQPTFAQHQVLTAQWNASAPSRDESSASDQAANKYGPYQAFLGPKSRAGFEYARKDVSALPADDLWLELYGRVATRLLQGELASRGSFARILRSVVPCGAVLVERLNRRLFVESDAQEQRRRLFGWAKQAATVPLASEIIESVDPLETASERTVKAYRPLRDDSFTLLWVMTIRLALGGSPVPEDDDLATVKAPLRVAKTDAKGGNDGKPADVKVRLSMHGPQRPPGEGDDVVLAIGNPSSKPPPVYSAFSTPIVRERDGKRGTLRRAAPVVDLQNVLRAEGLSAGDATRFDELLQRVVLFPTEPQRWGQRSVRSLSRRA